MTSPAYLRGYADQVLFLNVYGQRRGSRIPRKRRAFFTQEELGDMADRDVPFGAGINYVGRRGDGRYYEGNVR